MIKMIFSEAESKMQKAIEVMKKDFGTLRAGRATPALLEKVLVDYYNVPTPVNQLANISVPEPRSLTIQPWDKTAIGLIEKAILKSDLGLTPNNDGNIIRLNIPQLTQERRNDLVKTIKKKAEDARVAIRNIRRDANDQMKDLEKKHEISEDDSKSGQDDVQKITDKYVKEVDHIMVHKEEEIMEV